MEKKNPPKKSVHPTFRCSSDTLKTTTAAAGAEEFRPCRLLNVSECAVSERGAQFVLTLYNPLSRPVTEFARLPVPAETVYAVVDPDGRTLTAQLVPLPRPVLRVPGRVSTAVAELVFRADALPPLGYKSYLITRTAPQQRAAGDRGPEAAGSVVFGPEPEAAAGAQKPEAAGSAASAQQPEAAAGAQQPEAVRAARSVGGGDGGTGARVDVGDKVTMML